MFSELPVEVRCVVSRESSGSDNEVADDDRGLVGLLSEVRVERRESSSLAPLERRFAERLDCLRRSLEELPIISTGTTGHGGCGLGSSRYLESGWLSLHTGPLALVPYEARAGGLQGGEGPQAGVYRPMARCEARVCVWLWVKLGLDLWLHASA
jgi:hypothetical protein